MIEIRDEARMQGTSSVARYRPEFDEALYKARKPKRQTWSTKFAV